MCANCARVPFPGGNPSSGSWFVPLPLVVHEDVVEFSRSGSQGSDAAHLGLAGLSRGPAGMEGQSSCGQGLLGSACPSLDLEGGGSGEFEGLRCGRGQDGVVGKCQVHWGE